MNDEEQLELDIPETTVTETEEGLEKDIERNEKRRQEEYDEATKGNEEIRRLREARRGTGTGDTQLEIPGFLEARSGFRTTLGLGTEIFLNTLIDPIPEPGTQVLAGTVINALAQRIRGGETSIGEMTAAGAASLIPLGAQGRAIAQVAKGAGKGALAGGIETLGIAGIDEGKLPTKEELAAGLGIGAAFGGIVSTPQAAKALQKLRNRINGKKGEKFVKLTPDETLELGLEQPMESRFAEELTPTSAANLQNELDARAATGGYGFKYTTVASKKRRNQFGIPDDINSVYMNHAEAYKKAMGPNNTLEKFPTLLWNGERFRPKSKGTYVYFEKYLDRRQRQKLGTSRRAVRIWRQTRPGVAPGTFYREKLKQLRDLNTYEASLGLPESQRTRLRDADMDHKNALRSVEIYTEGLSDDNTKLVYDLLERYDLFTGDDARNLVLRNREIHRLLWPRMKAALKALNHKTIADFKTTKSPELEYLKYLAVDKNPKTGSTPLREYVETIKFIEEQAGDQALDALNQKVLNLYQGKQTNVQTPLRDRLVEILGGEENLKAFIERLKRDVPENIQPDLIEGEFNYIGSFGPLDSKQIADILNPPS